MISTCHAIRDCVRLGSYTERRNPPLLIKLNHSCDVLTILPNRHKLLQSSTVFIKPYQSPHERFTEATLLRQRSYSSSQVQTKKILEFVVIAFLSKSKKYGTASASAFKLHAPVSLAANNIINCEITSRTHDQGSWYHCFRISSGLSILLKPFPYSCSGP